MTGEQLWTAFLDAHPEWLDNVKYLPLPECDEPEMFVSTDATRAFIAWAQARGLIDAGQASKELAATQAVDAYFREK